MLRHHLIRFYFKGQHKVQRCASSNQVVRLPKRGRRTAQEIIFKKKCHLSVAHPHYLLEWLMKWIFDDDGHKSKTALRPYVSFHKANKYIKLYKKLLTGTFTRMETYVIDGKTSVICLTFQNDPHGIGTVHRNLCGSPHGALRVQIFSGKFPDLNVG